jgi:N-acetyl-anhydromuramyl-L-alanine amidase AmpD
MPSKPLPPNGNPTFLKDYGSGIVYPAHTSNYYHPSGHAGIPNRPRAWVLHTPEEDADDTEVTPAFFAQPNRQASTHYYLDSDGDVFQLVPESCGAIANGLRGKPPPKWADLSTSLNWQTLSVEIEGRAHTIHETMKKPQYDALVALIRDRARAWKIPLDREYIIGHYQVANDRSDPGARFPWDALMRDLTTGSAPEPPKETRHMKDWAIVGLENEVPDAYLLKDDELYLIPDAVVQEDLRKLIYEDDIIELHAVTWAFLDTIGIKRKL